MTSSRELWRRAGFALLVLCTVWLVIENGVLLALLAWSRLHPVMAPARAFAVVALAAAPAAWLAAVSGFVLSRRRARQGGRWPARAQEVPHA